jgi:surface antigen
VGVQQTIVISAPTLANQVVTIGFTSGAISNAGQTTLNSQGLGSLAWTPTSAGAWTVSALGSAVSSGSTTISVVPMPTITTALIPNQVQTGVTNNVTVAVTALGGIIPPAGTVTLVNQNQAVLGSATLSPLSGATSSANVQWTPTGGQSVSATYLPSSTAFGASTGAPEQPQTTSSVVTVALRFPPVLYVGTPTVIGAQTGTGVPAGSASFFFDGNGVIGSTPTNATGGVAATWTPPAGGNHVISTQFSSNNGAVSGTSQQPVNIQPAKPSDVITVDPVGGAPAWNPGLPISLGVGTSTALSATAQSGSPVVLSESGPCVINGSTLQTLAAGQCVVTATSFGSGTLTADTNTYTVTVTSSPRPVRPRR